MIPHLQKYIGVTLFHVKKIISKPQEQQIMPLYKRFNELIYEKLKKS